MEQIKVARPEGPDDLQGEMEQFFEHLGRWKRPVFFFEKAWKPLCDVSETGVDLVIVVELPGVTPENVHIEVHGSTLVMRGMRREPPSAPRRNYHLMEISYGVFEREIPLPVEVDADNARAVFVDGFLEIRLPKIPAPLRKEVDIDVPSE